MRGKSIALLVLALACGLVAAIGITQVIARRGTLSAEGTGETQPVFLALKDVAQGEPLTGEVLQLEQWPKSKVPSGALSRLEDIEGRRARSKLFAGELILDNKLAAKGVNAPGADLMIPKGYRVVSIRVDAVSGGANLLLPGCRVDLLVYIVKNRDSGIRETTTRTILQDIKVFAVNDVVTLETTGPETKSIPARTVSLLVTPAQAEKVTLATELGSVKLVMRGPEEEAQTQLPGAFPHELLGPSETAQREKEDMESNLNKLKEQGKGVLDYFTSLRASANVEKTAPPEPAEETWSMRILTGADVNDIILKNSGNSAIADAGSWILSSVQSTGTTGDKETHSPKAPVAPEEKKPAKTGTGPSGSGGRTPAAKPATPAAS